MSQRVLLTGATGYVGGRLLRLLQERGYALRCLTRKPEYLTPRLSGNVEVASGDALDSRSVESALEGIDAAYYLVHSMGSAGGFEELDRKAAENFARAARTRGVKRIIYLGGLGESNAELSAHLRSRQQVGEILASTGLPVIELRASVIIGSGSLSFELVRALVERLPVMITPRWVNVPAQPIAISDVLAYLLQGLEMPAHGHVIFEIGGADQVTYGDLMREYARQRRLRRVMIPVPFLTPRLSSLWLGLVTPVFARIGRKLVDSIRHPTVVRNPAGRGAFSVMPRGFREAIAEALRNEDREFAETHWWDSLASASASALRSWGGVRFGNRLVDRRQRRVRASAARAFLPIQKMGGETGWYFANTLWRIRGFLDLLAGGVGLRRGRRHPTELRVGDVVDWWRVEAFTPGRLLRLSAEMKIPGRAWLEYTIEEDGDHSVITQSAIFDPVGLAGLAYWYGIYPVHDAVFRGMLARIAREAEQQETEHVPDR
jgi:uncharacterized protein YbjT (DUF2867 family)